MGAWGLGSFDNDDAADWVLDLFDGDSLAPARDAISAVLGAQGYIEAPEAGAALAAAEVIAAALGRPTATAQAQEGVQAWVARVRPEVEPALAADARRAVARILGEDSELRELWEETDDYADWRAGVAALDQRLAA